MVVDIGSMTPGLAELAKWLNDPSYDLQPRPGAVEMLVAWRQKGYLVVYLTGLASSGLVGPTRSRCRRRWGPGSSARASRWATARAC